MFKAQIILSVVAVAIIAGLYTLPKSIMKSDRKKVIAPVTESVQAPASEEVHQTTTGTPEQQRELNRLRNLFTSTTEKKLKISLADSLANLYAGFQKPDSAAYFVEQIYTLNPSPENTLRAGDAYYEAWRFAAEGNKANPAGEKTRVYYEKVLAKNPDALEVKSRLAMTYSTTENPMQAIMMLREVISQEPANQTALFYLGLLSMRSGQYEKAIERFKQVLTNHPEDTEAHLYMGISYKQTGDIAAAKKEFLFVKETEKDPAILEAVEAYLKEIQ